MDRYHLYPTDMSDAGWEITSKLIPAAKHGRRPRTLDMRSVINAIFYIVTGGVQWRMLPREYPKWQSVYHYFRQWSNDVTRQRIHDTLRAQAREQEGRDIYRSQKCYRAVLWIPGGICSAVVQEGVFFWKGVRELFCIRRKS